MPIEPDYPVPIQPDKVVTIELDKQVYPLILDLEKPSRRFPFEHNYPVSI